MPTSTAALLRKLEATRLDYGPGRAARKRRLLDALARAAALPAQVLRLHEHLLFLRAYPDDRALHARAGRMLARFERRADLRRHRAALADSGIAGTAIHYAFFWPTARWLAARWPAQLAIDWDGLEAPERLAAALPQLVTPVEALWLRGAGVAPRRALERLRGRRTTDGAFLVQRVAALPGDDFTREAYFDALDTPLVLAPTRDTPSRTREHHAVAALAFRMRVPERARPDIARELARPPRAVRRAPAAEARRLIDLGRGAMATRGRDLDAFAYGNSARRARRRRRRWPRLGDHRRRTRAPTGATRALRRAYAAQRRADRLPRHPRALRLRRSRVQHLRDLPRRRGGVRARATPGGTQARPRRDLVHARAVPARPRQRRSARLRARGGSTTSSAFARAARRCGAWRAASSRGCVPIRATGRRRARSHAWPATISTSRRQAPARRTGRPWICSERASPHASRAPAPIARPRWRASVRAAMRLLGVARLRSADERRAWSRWAPIVAVLPGVARWPARDRRALARVISAKGGRSEDAYLARFAAHPRLGAVLRRLTGA
ncbi:MAG: hypothetical protein M5U08_18820 [Burkholderiales bacterium]|nr:hypothetical protein [Burkholderiales bacterium]